MEEIGEWGEEYDAGIADMTSMYPRDVDIDDGIARDVIIKQQVVGEVWRYGRRLEVMRFTLENQTRGAIRIGVLSLGAALQTVQAPDRRGRYKDVIVGFDNVDAYNALYNPGFGSITSLCSLHNNLDKVLWEWDIDQDEGSVTFSTLLTTKQTLLTVGYKLTTDNQIVITMRGHTAKPLLISLTNQVYWNLDGHESGPESLKRHTLSLNSDRVWNYEGPMTNKCTGVGGTILDFRIPSIMDNPQVFGGKGFDQIYLVSKGCKQSLTFLARMIHARSGRYVEVYSDQPWIVCSTLNSLSSYHENNELPGEGSENGDINESKNSNPSPGKSTRIKISKNCRGLRGKDGAIYYKYGSITIASLADMSAVYPALKAGKSYTHTIVYKIGVYPRFCKNLVQE